MRAREGPGEFLQLFYIDRLLTNRQKQAPCLQNLASKQGAVSSLVAHTGFEPVISSLRGRCPRPLDECAKVAGDPGFEPGLTDPESVVLPLD